MRPINCWKLEAAPWPARCALLAGYVYDANGSLTKKCVGGTVTRTAIDCTATGGATTSLTYDTLDRMTQAVAGATTESYAYDQEGKRIRKVSGATTTNFHYMGPDIYAEYGTTFTAQNAITTHGPNWDDPILRQTGTGPTAIAKFYHQDGLGSVVAVSTATGTTDGTQRFDAWGNKTTVTGAAVATYGYTGREPDASGLTYYRARYYDPASRRFTQRDPIGYNAGDINLYGYVSNNPVNYNDPSGEVALIDNLIGMGVNVAIGGAVRVATGGNFWDAKGIAIDAGVGFLTSGLAALNALRRGAEISEGIYVAKTVSNAKYVGQSGNIEGRLAQHVANGKITEKAAQAAQKFEILGGKTAREVAEQRIINGLGGVGNLGNKVNPIGGRMNLLEDSALGVATKNNLINWSGVVGADLGINLSFASTPASGETGLNVFTKGTARAPYSGSAQSGFNPRSSK